MKKQKEHIGIKIKRLRAFKGMNQEELAAKIGKTRSLISHFERTGSINKYTLQEIAEALEVDLQMLEEEDSKIKDSNKASNKAYSPVSVLNCKETIAQQKDEISFLKETINHQWQLLHEMAKKR